MLAPEISRLARRPAVGWFSSSRPAMMRSVRRSSPLSGPTRERLVRLNIWSPRRVERMPALPSTTADEVVNWMASPSDSPTLLTAKGLMVYVILDCRPSINRLYIPSSSAFPLCMIVFSPPSMPSPETRQPQDVTSSPPLSVML